MILTAAQAAAQIAVQIAIRTVRAIRAAQVHRTAHLSVRLTAPETTAVQLAEAEKAAAHKS